MGVSCDNYSSQPGADFLNAAGRAMECAGSLVDGGLAPFLFCYVGTCICPCFRLAMCVRPTV
jgi:hypothetical protein